MNEEEKEEILGDITENLTDGLSLIECLGTDPNYPEIFKLLERLDELEPERVVDLLFAQTLNLWHYVEKVSTLEAREIARNADDPGHASGSDK